MCWPASRLIDHVSAAVTAIPSSAVIVHANPRRVIVIGRRG
jgi:hypothetical protein